MKPKTFFLPREAIKPNLTPHRGSCIATDAITVHGARVGYCYREQPDGPLDSGWRFFAGSESQAYVDDPDNMALYDVNTIANYDPDIIALLESPVGSAFERDERTKRFVAIPPPLDPDERPT